MLRIDIILIAKLFKLVCISVSTNFKNNYYTILQKIILFKKIMPLSLTHLICVAAAHSSS